MIKQSAGFALLFLVGVAGCGGGDSFVPVTGQVRVGGQPASGALVMFYLDGPADRDFQPPTATVAADGTFSLTTGTSPGVKPGKYIVTVVWLKVEIKTDSTVLEPFELK
jgi:hypothetical protein